MCRPNFKLALLFLIPFFSFAQIDNWESRGVGGGGALFNPSISPHDATEMYIQCDMTEVFHTTNNGENWQEIPFQELISTGGSHSTEFTSNPDILYACASDFLTGSWYPSKSEDGGQTWEATTADPTFGETWYLSADNRSTERLLIASYTTLYLSLNGGDSFTEIHDHGDGIYIAGTYWKGDTILIGTSSGLFYSLNGGTDFEWEGATGIPADYGFLSFSGSSEGDEIKMIVTTAHVFDLYPGLHPIDSEIYSEILQSNFGSETWTNATTGIDPNHDLFFVSSALENVNIFYVGGSDPTTSYPVIYKTTNGGDSWFEIFHAINNENITTGWSGYSGDDDWWYGEKVFGLGTAPNDPNTIIFTDFGFAHISNDGGETWGQAYVNTEDQNTMGEETPEDLSYAGNGLENTGSWYLTWIDENQIFASYTDITGIRSTDGGEKWSFDYTGNPYNTTYHVVRDTETGTLYAAVSTVHDLYQSTYLTDARIDGGDGAVLYSEDNGVTWEEMADLDAPVIWLALDPNDNDVLYASVVDSETGGIYRTTNASDLATSSWGITTAPARTEGHPYNVFVLDDGSVLSTWCGRRDPGFTPSSGVFISADGGETWTDVSMDDEMYYWTKDITIDPHDSDQNTWYVAVFSGWGGDANDKGGLYRTTDRGENWELIFDSHRVESSTVSPTNPDELYLTTEAEGLWFTDNLTDEAPDFSMVDSYTFQHPVRVHYNPFDSEEIWVTSFGNGLKVSSLEEPGATINEFDSHSKIQVFPNPSNGWVNLKTDVAITSLNLYGVDGTLIYANINPSQAIQLPEEKGLYYLRGLTNSGEVVVASVARL